MIGAFGAICGLSAPGSSLRCCLTGMEYNTGELADTSARRESRLAVWDQCLMEVNRCEICCGGS